MGCWFNQKFENWPLVPVTMERADRARLPTPGLQGNWNAYADRNGGQVGGKNGNTVALLQNMECPDVPACRHAGIKK